MEKINLNAVWGFDSVTYRRIFEFIQREGIEPLEKLVSDLSEVERKNLIHDSLFGGKHATLGLVRKNQVAVEFLRQFKDFFLTSENTIGTRNFYHFFDSINMYISNKSLNPDGKNIDRLIENAFKLELLKICRIELISMQFGYNDFGQRTQVWKKDDNVCTIRKHYSDGEIVYTPVKDNFREQTEARPQYEEYRVQVNPNPKIRVSPTWIIETENHEDGKQYRYAKINSWDFDTKLLPTNEELSCYEEPYSLKLFKNK